MWLDAAQASSCDWLASGDRKPKLAPTDDCRVLPRKSTQKENELDMIVGERMRQREGERDTDGQTGRQTDRQNVSAWL